MDVQVAKLNDGATQAAQVAETAVQLHQVTQAKPSFEQDIATLDETLRAAQATQRSLRVERELAERIERGIKSLRTKIGSTNTTDEEEQTA